MSFQIIFKEEARAEIIRAFEWYELQLEGLGIKFKNEVDDYLKRIQKSPGSFQSVYKEFRHAVLKKISFSYFFYS